MKIQATFDVWLSDPASLALLDGNMQARRLNELTYLFSPDLNMASCGYHKIGTAQVEYDIEIESETAVAAAAKNIIEKIDQIEKKAEREVAVLREGLRRLQAITYEG